MILQALTEYYDRKTRDGGTELAPAGFEPKEIPFIVVLDQNGNFVDLEDTRDGDGKTKTGQIRFVPKGINDPGKTVGKPRIYFGITSGMSLAMQRTTPSGRGNNSRALSGGFGRRFRNPMPMKA